jgi:hypothetical protein
MDCRTFTVDFGIIKTANGEADGMKSPPCNSRGLREPAAKPFRLWQ